MAQHQQHYYGLGGFGQPAMSRPQKGTITEFYAPGGAPVVSRPPPPPRPPLPYRPDLRRQGARHTFTGHEKPLFQAPDRDRPVPIEALDHYAAYIDCPSCNARTLTYVKKESGEANKKVSLFMMFPVLLTGLIPYLFQWCCNLGHYCSRCRAKVAHQEYLWEESRLTPAVPTYKSRQYKKNETGKQPSQGAGELEGRSKAQEADGQQRVEKDGNPRHEAEGTRVVAEMEANEAVHEMEHVNRGVGTQKRIREIVKISSPMPNTDQKKGS